MSFSENYFEQIVRETTRERNILDLLATNRPELFESVRAEEAISGHKAVKASVTTGVVRNVKKGRKIYLLSKSDRKQIAEYLRSNHERFVSEDEDVDQK